MKKIALTFFLLFISYIVLAQEFATRLYTPKDGLVQAQVQCVTIDSNAYVWMGTIGGLSRFDGLEFKDFTEKDGLSSKNIYDLQWYDDTLYVVTREGVDMIVNDSVSNLYFDGNTLFMGGKIKVNSKYKYATGHNFGYSFFVNLKTGKLTRLPDKFQEVELNRGAIIVITGTSFLIAKDNSVYEMPFGDTSYRKLFGLQEKIDGLGPLKHNKIPVTYRPSNLPKKKTVAPVVSNAENEKIINGYTFIVKQAPDYVAQGQNGDLYRTFVTSSGNCFYGTVMGDLFYEENGKVLKLPGNYTNVIGFVEGKYGNAWFATEKGLLKINLKKFRYYTPNQGFVDNVWAVAGFNDSLILMGSYNKGIHLYQNGAEKKYVDKSADFGFCYFGICKGFDNDFLITLDHGIGKYNYVTNTLTSIDDKLHDLNYTLCKDKINNRVLVANLRKLVAINPDYSTEVLFDISTLGNHKLITALCVKKNKVFIGLLRGLIVFDTETKKAKSYFQNGKLAFYSLLTDNHNTVWAATNNGLLKILDDTSYFVRHPALTDNLSSLVIDNHNRLFITGQTTLFIIDLDKYYKDDKAYLSYYGFSDGYLGDNPEQDAFYKDDNGHLWFPTGYRVIEIFPDDLNENNQELITQITKMQTSTGDTSALPIDLNNKIDIRYASNNISIDYLSINLQNPERTEYSYLLKPKNVNRSWEKVTKSRQVTFNNLPPGKYTFTVKASVSGSFENAKAAVLEFAVLPPFWQTIWFIVLAGLVFIVILYLTYVYVKKREEKKNRGKMEVLDLKNQALSTQMDNHFIVNISSKMVLLYENGKIEEGNRYTRTFSRFLQQNLQLMRKNHISLADEIQLIENYVYLERIHAKNFEFQIDIDGSVDPETISIPPLMIQPLIENAIKYGVKKTKPGEGKIGLHITSKKDSILITIEDNGPGFQHDKAQNLTGNSVSLKIIKERMGLMGKNASMKIESSSKGTRIAINIGTIAPVYTGLVGKLKI